MIKMICVDLDGTLLHSDKTISNYTIEVLKKAIDNKIIIVPVTGRHCAGIPEELLKLDIKYAICSNGAVLYDFKLAKSLRKKPIPKDILLEFLDRFVELDIMADLFTEKDAYTDYRNLDILNDIDASDAVKNYIRKSRIVVDNIKDFYIKNKPEIQKITMNFRKIGNEYKNKDLIYKELSCKPELVCVTGGAGNIEVTSAEATKGKCIEYLSKISGISISEIMSIGDTENDISMLNATGYSVAMKNADDELKAISNTITSEDNDSDGAAKFIAKITESEGRIC